MLAAAGGYFTDSVPRVDFGSGPPPSGDALTRCQDSVTVPDAGNHVGHSSGATFLFQASETDEYVSVQSIEAYLEAAPEPRSLGWYSGGHLGCAYGFSGGGCSCDASTDRLVDHRAWLQENV